MPSRVEATAGTRACVRQDSGTRRVAFWLANVSGHVLLAGGHDCCADYIKRQEPQDRERPGHRRKLIPKGYATASAAAGPLLETSTGQRAAGRCETDAGSRKSRRAIRAGGKNILSNHRFRHRFDAIRPRRR